MSIKITENNSLSKPAAIFAPLHVYLLTGVLEIFLVNSHLKVVEEHFP